MNPKPQILLVDDDDRLLRTLRILFAPLYDVYTATDGATAIDILRQQHINVIVSDQVMPVMEGVELLRLAREISPHTIRLLLTGYADLAAIVGSVNEGEIFRYINKPWDNDEILSTVAAAIEASRIEEIIIERGEELPEPPVIGDSPHIILNEAGQKTGQMLKSLFGERYAIQQTTSFQDALELIKKVPASILLTELEIGDDSIKNYLTTLRRQYPSLVIMIMTEFRDVELLIELINEGQVFRFLSRPVRRSVLEISIKAALRRHHQLNSGPVDEPPTS